MKFWQRKFVPLGRGNSRRSHASVHLCYRDWDCYSNQCFLARSKRQIKECLKTADHSVGSLDSSSCNRFCRDFNLKEFLCTCF